MNALARFLLFCSSELLAIFGIMKARIIQSAGRNITEILNINFETMI